MSNIIFSKLEKYSNFVITDLLVYFYITFEYTFIRLIVNILFTMLIYMLHSFKILLAMDLYSNNTK